jgi:CubicO group peptidase (beta-lactamase class C family)
VTGATGSHVEAGYEAVRDELAAVAEHHPGYSAQVATYVDGRLVLDLSVGDALPASALTGVFSVTKGAAGIVTALLVQRGSLELDRAVIDYWPEFAAHGKGEITVRQLLSHQAGLIGLEGGISTADLVDSRAAAARLAAMRPVWRPGAMFGYHGLTIGILAEELVMRVTGERLCDIFERDVRSAGGHEFYLGFPKHLESRYRPVLPVPAHYADAIETGVVQETQPDGLADLMANLDSPDQTLLTSTASPNLRAIRAAGPAAIGGIGNAVGLAGIYAAAVGAFDECAPLLEPGTVAAVGQEQVWGRDRLLGKDMSFAVLFMKPHPGFDFGSHLAFGHDGAGGAIGFADPRYRLGFGYIPAPMQPPGGADPKGVRLAQLVRACVARVRNR